MGNTRFGLRKQVSVIFEGTCMAPAASHSTVPAQDRCTAVQRLQSQIEYVVECLLRSDDPRRWGRV